MNFRPGHALGVRHNATLIIHNLRRGVFQALNVKHSRHLSSPGPSVQSGAWHSKAPQADVFRRSPDLRTPRITRTKQVVSRAQSYGMVRHNIPRTLEGRRGRGWGGVGQGSRVSCLILMLVLIQGSPPYLPAATALGPPLSIASTALPAAWHIETLCRSSRVGSSVP